MVNSSSPVNLSRVALKERDKLSNASVFLAAYEDRLVILGETHRVPDLFLTLRGLIDQGRRRNKRTGRFLLLDSASLDLMRQSGEPLYRFTRRFVTGAPSPALPRQCGQTPDEVAQGLYPRQRPAPCAAQYCGQKRIARPPGGRRKLGNRRQTQPRRQARPRVYEACEDLKPGKRFVIHAGLERFAVSDEVQAIGVRELVHTLSQLA